MNLRRELENRLQQALAAAGAPSDSPALIAPAAKAQFGDYQANGVMAAAKKIKANPRELAAKVVAAAKIDDLVEKLEVAGPGFINIHLRREFIQGQLAAAVADGRLGASTPAAPQRVVVDYSAPNLAKEMHVGHLRSTIIGDALARILSFLGHDVIRQNHVGDWGTQFGMLLAFMDREAAAGHNVSTELADLENFYRQAKQLFDADAAFAAEARQYVVRLQGGDAHCLQNWRMFLDASLHHCEDIYRRLGVLLTRDDVRGESAYNDDLAAVVADLQKLGLLTESQGAQCVFLPEFVGKDGTPLPLIVQKSDEGFLYATTDLAAVRYRVGTLHAQRVLYVVDARQSLHFRQMFAVARKAGFVPEAVSLEHIAFGTMMGDDGKPFKTRSGGTVKLVELLNEAVERAYALVTAKSPEIPEDERRQIAQAVGVGGVKYADLAQNRTSDYVFSWDKMLSMEGNTAPYMQYAYARVQSIFRKGETGEASLVAGIQLTEPAERALAVKLLQFTETLDVVAAECLPNLLCAYLYEVAGAYMSFYESCPVLQSAEPTRSSRLNLCRLTARTIQKGLNLLGIETLERM